MSVALSYRSWVTDEPRAVETQSASLRAHATPRAAMNAVAVVDATILLVVAIGAGLPLAAWWTWVALAGGVGALAVTGHYRPRITLSVAVEAAPLAACGAAPFLVLALVKVPGASTATLSVGAALAMVLLVVARCTEYWLGRALRRRGWFVQRTLFVGAGDVSAKLAATLDEHPEYGLLPVGFVDEVDSSGLPSHCSGESRCFAWCCPKSASTESSWASESLGRLR
jgi:FlaA1/EpsC-like NDP-sugar epimerase